MRWQAELSVAIYSQAKYGEVRWQDVVAGAAIGGILGATGGAAVAYIATGRATASTATVIVGIGGSATALPEALVLLQQLQKSAKKHQKSEVNWILYLDEQPATFIIFNDLRIC